MGEPGISFKFRGVENWRKQQKWMRKNNLWGSRKIKIGIKQNVEIALTEREGEREISKCELSQMQLKGQGEMRTQNWPLHLATRWPGSTYKREIIVEQSSSASVWFESCTRGWPRKHRFLDSIPNELTLEV